MVGRLREEWDPDLMLSVVLYPRWHQHDPGPCLLTVSRPASSSAVWAKPRGLSRKHSPAFRHVHPDPSGNVHLSYLYLGRSPVLSFTLKASKLRGVSLSTHCAYPMTQFMCRRAEPLLKDPPVSNSPPLFNHSESLELLLCTRPARALRTTQ